MANLTENLKDSMTATFPREFDIPNAMTIQEIYDKLNARAAAFQMPFSVKGGIPGERVVFEKEPNLDVIIWLHVKDGTHIKITPVTQDIITPEGKGKHYGEWKAEQDGRPTVRGIIREDIDRIIGEAYTYQTFLLLLQRNGYEIKSGPNRKYTAVRPPGGKRFVRLDSLGEGYTEEAIKQRLMGQRSGATQKPKQSVYHTKRYRVKGKLSRYPKRKITGFLALYFRYVYLLRGARRAKPSYRAAFPIRKEVIRLERYQKQFQYLMAQNITTPAQLAEQISNLEAEITKLTEERKPLYGERRNAPDEEAKAQCTAEIDRHTASLREKRRELALCRRIQADIPQVREQVQEAQTNQKIELRKEEQQHEYQRRNR